MTTPRLHSAVWLAGLTALVSACSGSIEHPAEAPILPLRSVRLYETGVGYFERAGALDGAGATLLPVPSGHLDDALETLVVLGAGGGGEARVHGVEWGSSLSHGMARAVAGLPAGEDKPTRLQDLVAGLKGSRLQAEMAGTREAPVAGRLVDLSEEAADGAAKAATPRLTLLILSDAGDLVRVDAATMKALRPLDPAHAARLGARRARVARRRERAAAVRAVGGRTGRGRVRRRDACVEDDGGGQECTF